MVAYLLVMWRDLIHTLNQTIDWLFPLSPAVAELKKNQQLQLEHYYSPQRFHGTQTLTSYQKPYIKAAIVAGKYEHTPEGLVKLGTLVAWHCQLQQVNLSETLFVPIPIHPRRQRERGYNQVEVILKAAHTILPDLKYLPLLFRTEHTETQSHLGKNQRHQNIIGAFAVTTLTLPPNLSRVIIFDDVITTGSTLREAVATLRPHLPAHITLETMAVARAQ